MRPLAFAVALLAALLTGCATPIPLDTVRYEHKTSVASDKDASVVIVSGVVSGSSATTMVPIGAIFVPLSTGPNPGLQFNVNDQRAFGESLRKELVRLGIVKSASDFSAQPKDLKVQVNFVQTYHNPNLQQYSLDVTAELTGGKAPMIQQYRVLSSEKDTFWERTNTTAYQGKAKAVRLLLEKMIPDIERYVAAME